MYYKVIRLYAEPFHAALHHLCVRCSIRHYAEPFHATLHCLYVRCTILYYTELFHATLHRLCVRCATRHYPVPFDATLHRLCTVLQMSAKLFVIEPVHFTISCSNSTWATGFKVVSLQSRFAATRVDSLHTQSRFAKHLRSFRFKLHKPKSRFATLSLPHLNSRNFREYCSVTSFSNVKLLRFDR